jgi:hypothetical protein
MSRDRRRNRVETPPARPTGSTQPLDGALVGYRLLRRIASGERADVYLAAAESAGAGALHDPGAFAPSTVSATSASLADSGAPSPPLVAVRVYPPHVSSDSVALEIEAMSADTTGTLPALFDVAALDDGSCCLAVERVSGAPVSRLLTDRTLSAGEAVTILAPIVVAVADLAARGLVHTRLAATDILLDDAGRPRLIGLGALRRLPTQVHAGERTGLLRTGHAALAELLEDVAAAVRPAGVFDDAIDLIRARLDARPFQTCEAELERRLFAAAAPEPVAGIDVRTRTLRLPARIGAPMAVAPQHDDEERAEEHPVTRRAHGIRALLGLAQLPEDLGARVASAIDDVPGSRARTRIASAIRARSRALTVGGLIGGGALVLMLTLVPPATATDQLGRTDDVDVVTEATAGDAEDASTGTDRASVEAETEAKADEAEEAPVVAGDDAAAAARSLLVRRVECFATLDLECLEAVAQPGSAIESTDRTRMLAARDGAVPPDDAFDLTTVQVTAEMGDAVLIGVTRATPQRQPVSLLVVRGEAGWRLREIFD